MKRILLLRFLTVFLAISPLSTFAFMHVGFIHYRHLTGLQFEMTLVMFKNNPAPPFPNSITIAADLASTGGPPDLLFQVSKNDSVPLPNDLTSFRWQDTITLTQGGEWTFILKNCCRPMVDNMNVSLDSSYAITAYLNTNAVGGLSSARFDIPPMTLAQWQTPLYFNPGFYDRDHDSMYFTIAAPRDTIGPFGTPNPTWTRPSGMVLDSLTGEINWTPADTGNFEIRLILDEFDSNGLKKTTTEYDLFFIVRNFPGNLRTAFINTGTWPVNADGRFEFSTPAALQFTLVATAQDPDGDDVDAMKAGGENLTITTIVSTFSPVPANDSTMVGTLQWTPDPLDVRSSPYVVVFRAEENKVVQKAFSDLTVNIIVTPALSSEENETPFPFKMWPNPSDDQVAIEFFLHESREAELEITDLSGRKVSGIPDMHLDAGHIVLLHDIRNLSAGMYLVSLKSGNTLLHSGKLQVQ